MKHYVVVTFGIPGETRPTYRLSVDMAKKDAIKAKGSGRCTAARVYECNTRALALTADISKVRNGERVIFNA